jgi:hypothetical protein
MISFNSIKNFISINVGLIGLSLLEHMFYENYGIFTLLVLRNYILIDVIEYNTRNNENIEALIHANFLNKEKELGGQLLSDFTKVDTSILENRSMISIGG